MAWKGRGEHSGPGLGSPAYCFFHYCSSLLSERNRSQGPTQGPNKYILTSTTFPTTSVATTNTTYLLRCGVDIVPYQHLNASLRSLEYIRCPTNHQNPASCSCIRYFCIISKNDTEKMGQVTFMERDNPRSNYPESRVLIIMTGGTICMQPSADGLVPMTGFLENAMAPRPSFNDSSAPSGKLEAAREFNPAALTPAS